MMQFEDIIQMPSEMPDSVEEISQEVDNPSIKEINLYQLNDSISEEQSSSRQIEMDPTLNESSIDHDDFLDIVQREEQMLENSSYHSKQAAKTSADLLLVDKAYVQLTILESQSTKETITFTNPTSSAIKMRLQQCPFQVQTDKKLGFISAGQLQVMLEPWDRVELVFVIEQSGESYGDLYENVVVLGEFVGRDDIISPVSIQFHVRYISPALTIKYEGRSDCVSLLQGKMNVAHIKGNKLGEYCLQLQINDEISKMEINIQTRGKVTSSMQSTTLYNGQAAKLKLRPRGSKSLGVRQKCGLLFRPANSKICYVLGIEFIE